ncbi:hypothetical protein RHMOL_Rhmol05G0264400 [Rhododendron molle]|uniref:Uncharacterized protein n=1 Tax=Rhododendron molle TaxID=49168 RepID=A0ACC0NVG0_RHOML|nr:hypothetical protein RHMOL_Rhmol05G0264400 [Rhododendron molle]
MVTNFANSSHSAALRAALTWTPKSLTALRRILTYQPDILTQRDAQGNTILHFLAAGGNATAFRELFEGGLLRRSNRGGGGGELRTRNSTGGAVLHEAARLGNLNVVEVIMEREIELVSKRKALGETPLYSAAANGEEEVFNLLIVAAAHDRELLRRDDDCTILHAVIMGEHYSMPMWINESKLTEDVEDLQRNKPFICQSIGCFVENIISVVPWLRAVHDVKKKHACALKLAKTLIANEEDWSHYTNSCGRYIDYDDDYDQPIITTGRHPLLQAAENSILELAKEILGKFPEAAYCFDSNGKNIFHIAVENKDCTMYSFLKKNVARKDWMMAALDHDQNSILHLAAKTVLILEFSWET